VILDNACQFRERGNTWIDGIEIEYFKNPPSQIRKYFASESSSPHTAHMLAYGELVYCESEEVKELIKEAKIIIDKRPTKLNAIQVEFEKYFVDDLFKDLEDSILNKDDVASIIIRNKLIDRCVDVFCKVHQIRREKDKRIYEQIKSIDKRFLISLKSALNENWEEMNDLKGLTGLTEDLLGGPRSKEWIIKSDLDL